MGETNTPKNTVDVPVDRYQAILETNLEQSIEITRLKNALQTEYAYAEGLLKEINQLNRDHSKEVEDLRAEIKLMIDFLNSNHLVSDYNAFANAQVTEE